MNVPGLETAYFVGWLAQQTVRGVPIGIEKAGAITTDTMAAGCILCRGRGAVLGCFVPAAGRGIVLYALCAEHSAAVHNGAIGVDAIERLIFQGQRSAGAV